MKNLYQFVTEVTERYPNVPSYLLGSYKLLAHDIKADIDMNHPSYPTDTGFLKYVDGRLHTLAQKRALKKFKLLYGAWLDKQQVQ